MFEKGRQKTGGRVKKVEDATPAARKSHRLVDRLLENGFDFHKEFAKALKDLPDGSGLIGTKYIELRNLLPFMAPKLKEKEVDVSEQVEERIGEKALSTADILEALGNGSEQTKVSKRPSNSDTVGKGSINLLDAPGAEVNLQDLAGEQTEDE